jgi:plasmid stabilization system protein ParE
MRQLVYLASARDDLTSIVDYITRESGSVAVGIGFTNSLRRQCAKLAALPGSLGSPRPELRPDVRSFAFRGYVIFFRYDGKFLEVVNILKGHRDIVAYYGDDTT